VAFSNSKDTLFGVCTFLQCRLKSTGAKSFLRATKGVLGALPFVVEAVLWTTVAVFGGIGDVPAGAALAVSKRP
jgi:hypothetical protein